MNRRTSLVSEIRIEASCDRLWEIIGATARYAEWVVNTLAVTRSDGPLAQPGVTYDEHNRIIGPWTARSTWRVISADAPRHTIHEATGIPLAVDLRLELTLTPDAGATHYRHVISYAPAFGPLGRLIDRVVAPSLRRDGRRTVANLKALAES
jgi:hypothetical protein